jgi:hypothetical protein
VVQKYHKMNLWVTEHQAYSKTGGEGTDPAPRGPELKYFDTRWVGLDPITIRGSCYPSLLLMIG